MQPSVGSWIPLQAQQIALPLISTNQRQRAAACMGKLMSQEAVKTAGQVERKITQALNALYRKELGHQPGKITCQLFEAKAVLVIEDALSRPEQLLLAKGDSEVALQAHEEVLEVLKTMARSCIAEATQMSVVDILVDSNVETSRMGLIVMLEGAPEVRNPSAIPKNPVTSKDS